MSWWSMRVCMPVKRRRAFHAFLDHLFNRMEVDDINDVDLSRWGVVQLAAQKWTASRNNVLRAF